MNQHSVSVSTSIKPLSGSPSAEDERLMLAAREAAAKAYAPYSKFRVGAAALLDNGEVVAASNQENAAYPTGLCAERTTVFYANAKYPEAKILRLLIYAETDKGPVRSPITPCGACRQVLLEKEVAQGAPMRISLCGADDLYHLPGVAAALLPLSFVPKSLDGE